MTTLVDLLEVRSRSGDPGLRYTWIDDELGARASLTGEELGQRARAIAAVLQDHGLAGARVLLAYPPCLDFLSALFGCLYAQVIAVPCYAVRNTRDERRIAGIIYDCEPAAVLTSSGNAAGLEQSLGRISGGAVKVLATDVIQFA